MARLSLYLNSDLTFTKKVVQKRICQYSAEIAQTYCKKKKRQLRAEQLGLYKLLKGIADTEKEQKWREEK